MFDLHGRVAVVTGASAGLGRQFALALARQGADLAILARREWKLNEVAEEIRAVGVKCLVVRCDVREPEDVANAVKAVIAEYGKVDILVNNAGGGKSKPLDEFPEEDWIDTVNTDVFGVMRCTRDFGREMLKAGYGRIINIASILGKGGLPEIPISDYAASKGAVINFTHQMATEWAQKGITVNCICPGFFPSEANNPEAMKPPWTTSSRTALRWAVPAATASSTPPSSTSPPTRAATSPATSAPATAAGPLSDEIYALKGPRRPFRAAKANLSRLLKGGNAPNVLLR